MYPMSLPDPPSFEELEERGLPPRAVATKQEMAQARQDRKNKPKNRGIKAEQWARLRMRTWMDADLKKNSDAPDAAGFYRGGHVDYTGSMSILWHRHVRTVPVQVEVKAFTNNFALSSLSSGQREILSTARLRGELAIVTIVQMDRKTTIQRAWFVPWRGHYQVKGMISTELDMPDWEDVEQYLREQAMGNFKGKSFRPDKDGPYIKNGLTTMMSSRWVMPDWLVRIKPTEGEQLPL